MDTNHISPVGDWHDIAPWRRPAVFLLLAPVDGLPIHAHNVGDKRALALREDGVLMVGWTGQYRTDVRLVTADDRDQVRAHLA